MRQPSIGKIILNDYASFLLAIGGPIALAITAFTAALGFIPRAGARGGRAVDPQFAAAACVFAVIITVLLLFLLARRISRIKRILAAGPRTKASVLDVGFFKDRGRIEFEYTHNGRQYTTGTAIMKNKQTTAISPGDEIEVAVDPDNPRKAFVVQLYCS
jgi:hypothetical protein